MNIKSSHLVYGILLIALLLSILPWLKEGVPVTDDYRHHAMRMWFVKEQIAQGTFSEWMPHLYGGWPFSHFYHPMFYLISLPFAAFFNPIAALKIMTIVAFAIALFGTFYAARLLFQDKKVALVASIAYFLSSHFLFNATISGALPRLTAIALVPLVAAFFIKAIQEQSKKYILSSSILLAILLMMHTSVAIPMFIMGFVYLLYMSYVHKSLNLIGKGILIFFIAGGISAAWLLPLMLEKEHANISESNVLEAPLIEQSFRTFGIVHDGEKYIRSNYFGYSVFALALFSLFFVRKNSMNNLMKVSFVTSLLFYFNIFGLLNIFPFIKAALTGSTSFFISMVVFSAAMLAGVAAQSLSKKFNKKYLLFVIAILIVIELYPALNAFSYSWSKQPTENFVNPPQLIDAWNFIKNQEGNFVVLSAIGQAAEIYHKKQEFGFDWVGCPQCVQRDVYEIHNELWQNFTKGNKNDDVFGYFSLKYYVIPCQYKLNNTLAYSNGAVCVYENEKFKPLIESNAAISNVKFTLNGASFKTESPTATSALIKINNFKPHWKAYVDNEEIPIEIAWPAFSLIKVPLGEHNIVLDYTTNNLHVIAWAITLVTLAATIYFTRK